MTRSPQSDAAANGANAKEELYNMSCRLERENAKLRDALQRLVDTHGNCNCGVSDTELAAWDHARIILSNAQAEAPSYA
jgi:hypothetical protein